MRAKVKGFAGVVRVAWAAMCAIASGRNCYVAITSCDNTLESVEYAGACRCQLDPEYDAWLDEDTSHNA